jgi:hypothetical protein
MSAALVVMEDNCHSSTYTEAENLARHIISRMDSVTAKLKSLEDDIRRLWLEFDKLKTGETILGCATKKEFCERKLNRTPRAIRYMLDGGNLSNQRGEEIISPAPVQPSQPTKSDPLKRPAPVYVAPAKPETHWISKENGCPSGKRAFDSPESLHKARKAEGKHQPVAFFNCQQCGMVHMDKGQTADRHTTFYPAPPAPHTPVDPNKINRHLVGAQVGDVVNYNSSAGTCDACIVALDDKEVTIQTGKTNQSVRKFPLDVDSGTIRQNISKAKREPDYVRHTGRKGHCEKCRMAGLPNGKESCVKSEPVSNPEGAAEIVHSISQTIDRSVASLSKADQQIVYRSLAARLQELLDEN